MGGKLLSRWCGNSAAAVKKECGSPLSLGNCWHGGQYFLAAICFLTVVLLPVFGLYFWGGLALVLPASNCNY